MSQTQLPNEVFWQLMQQLDTESPLVAPPREHNAMKRIWHYLIFPYLEYSPNFRTDIHALCKMFSGVFEIPLHVDVPSNQFPTIRDATRAIQKAFEHQNTDVPENHVTKSMLPEIWIKEGHHGFEPDERTIELDEEDTDDGEPTSYTVQETLLEITLPLTIRGRGLGKTYLHCLIQIYGCRPPNRQRLWPRPTNLDENIRPGLNTVVYEDFQPTESVVLENLSISGDDITGNYLEDANFALIYGADIPLKMSKVELMDTDVAAMCLEGICNIEANDCEWHNCMGDGLRGDMLEQSLLTFTNLKCYENGGNALWLENRWSHLKYIGKLPSESNVVIKGAETSIRGNLNGIVVDKNSRVDCQTNVDLHYPVDIITNVSGNIQQDYCGRGTITLITRDVIELDDGTPNTSYTSSIVYDGGGPDPPVAPTVVPTVVVE